MKKLILTTMLLGLVFALSLSVVSAGEDWSDPVLCVAGQWLVVDAAKDSAVHIVIPDNTPYGNEGKCKTPAPGPLFVKDVVKEIGRGHTILVTVNGRQASTPTVTVSYGKVSTTKRNNGIAPLIYLFDLH
jgi:hypothetical protein